MGAKSIAALAVFLASAIAAQAQIPRDPLGGASAASAGPPASAGSQREPGQPYVTRQADVEIPFSVRPGTTPESQPTAVRIFVSWDQGKTWHFYDERRPEEGRFRFRPRQDGEFWFATQTIDRSGRPDSPEPRLPQLRLIVDTQRPQLLVQAQVDASGNVHVAFSAADPTLLPESLKLEYQDAAGTGGPWQVVETSSDRAASVTARVSGQTSFRPQVGSLTINLRAEIADAAGNIAYYSQRLSLVPPQPKPAGGLAVAPAADPSATPWPAEAEQAGGAAIAAGKGAAAEQVAIPGVVQNPFVGPGRLASTTSSPPGRDELPRLGDELPPPPGNPPSPPSFGPMEASSAAPRSMVERLPMPARDETIRPEPSLPPGPGSVAPQGPEIMPAPQPDQPPGPSPGQRPRLTNSRRFSLEYDVETVGPEGLSAVELWGTTDGGRTWVKWGADPDKTSPFDVEVNHESVYGFRIVIVGKNGLATSTPQPGDNADIWVCTDLTPPKARLTGASYGQGPTAGKLDIRWEAEDANLGMRPVVLSISDRPDGPFTPIAAGLPNTGQYYWEFDPRSPRQIYLRLEVRDEAGNVGIDQLREPIKVEGLEPKGRIRDLNPSPETARGAFRTPLFR